MSFSLGSHTAASSFCLITLSHCFGTRPCHSSSSSDYDISRISNGVAFDWKIASRVAIKALRREKRVTSELGAERQRSGREERTPAARTAPRERRAIREWIQRRA